MLTNWLDINRWLGEKMKEMIILHNAHQNPLIIIT